MSKKFRTAIEIILGVIIISFLLTKIDLKEVWEALLLLDGSWFPAIIITYVIMLFLTCYSLKLLFNSIKNLPFWEWCKYYFMGFSLGLILPGRAGDLSIIYFIKKKGIHIGEGTALTIIDKAVTLTIFGILAFIGLFTILEAKEITYGVIAALVIVSGGMLTFTKTGRNIIKKLIGKYAGTFRGFHNAFTNLIHNHKEKLLGNILITLIRPLGNGLLIVLIFSALGYEMSLLYATLISSITLIASLAPFTPNGVGIREGVGAYLFLQVGIPLEVSVGMYLIILAMNYSTGIVGTGYYLSRKKK